MIDVVLERIEQPVPSHIRGQSRVFYVTGPDAFTEGVRRYLRDQGSCLPDAPAHFKNGNHQPVHVIPHLAFHLRAVVHSGTGTSDWKNTSIKLLV